MCIRDRNRAVRSARSCSLWGIKGVGCLLYTSCEELLSKKDVDGGLIGGASLKAPDFAVIVNASSNG